MNRVSLAPGFSRWKGKVAAVTPCRYRGSGSGLKGSMDTKSRGGANVRRRRGSGDRGGGGGRLGGKELEGQRHGLPQTADLTSRAIGELEWRCPPDGRRGQWSRRCPQGRIRTACRRAFGWPLSQPRLDGNTSSWLAC